MKTTSHRRTKLYRRDYFRKLPDAELLFLLETGEVEVQRVACHELGRRQLKEAVALLMRRLESEDLVVREAAADALGMIGDQQAGPALLELFANSQQPDQIRDTSAYALARLAFRPALPKLLSALADPSPTVRSCVVAALAAIAEPQTKPLLEIACETESNAEVRTSMLALIRELPTPRRSVPMLSIFRGDKYNVQALHNRLVGQLEPPAFAALTFLRVVPLSAYEGSWMWRDAERYDHPNILGRVGLTERKDVNYARVKRLSERPAAHTWENARLE